MKLSIAHICLVTRDLEATLKFYRDILEMEKVFDFIHEGALHGYYMRMSDGNYLEIFEDKEAESKVSGPFLHLCLETDDIERSYRKLQSRGVTVSDIKKGPDQTYQFWFKDPNGLDIEIHQYTTASSQITGADCQVDWL